MSTILSGLSAAQSAAAQAYKGPSLVIAGAGSGKTRVLTHRIAYMLEQGIKPYNVLALTFTNKAAREMRSRIAALIAPEAARQLWVGTFHAIFAKILRIEAASIGFTSNFTIYDPADSKGVIRSIVQNLGLDAQAYKDGIIHSRISYAKNNLIVPEQYALLSEQLANDREYKIPYTYKVYAQYVKQCKGADAMDFDDLLLYPNLLFRDSPTLLAKYRDRFRYILVDEYQDTNSAQYFIVQSLSEQHQNLCVVGDDAQSIYAFRGANIQNILNFQKDYPRAQVFKLEQNYRSTQTIVNAANSLIAKNRGQMAKTCFSAGSEGERLRVIKCESDHEEGCRIASDLEARRNASRAQYSDFAILYRTNAQSRIFEDALRRKSIPYKIYAGMSFYQRKEIKDLLAYLRLIVNTRDNEALLRIVNYPKRGIGDTTIEHISALAAQMGRSMWDTILSLSPAAAGITGAAYKKLAAFFILMDNLRNATGKRSAYDLAKDVAYKSGIMDDLRSENSAINKAREENVEELLNSIKAYCDSQLEETGEEPHVAQYLETVSLLTDADHEDEQQSNSVTLMTVHSAKGLEFGYVYIVGLEDGLFPSSASAASAKDIEEERRLFYVALTRAKRYAALSFAVQRMKWGRTTPCMVSRFIKELDARCLSLPDDWSYSPTTRTAYNDDDDYSFPYRRTASIHAPSPALRPSDGAVSVSTAQCSGGTLRIGSAVRHERFGRGNVTALETIDGDPRATIDFASSGSRTLILRYAKLVVEV